MNDSSYTILIPVLLLLLAAMVGMLYARFAFRSRENSDEIDLVDVDLAESRISAAASVDDRSKADDTERVPFLDPRPGMTPVLEVASADSKEVSESDNDESEYFDELQEAAAGLAALMRSSPVGRSTPVVYAPDDVEDEIDDSVEAAEALVSEDEPQEILLPVSELVSDESDAAEEVVDAIAAENAEIVAESPTTAVTLEENAADLAEVNESSPEPVATVEDDASETAEPVNAELSADPVTESTAVLNAVVEVAEASNVSIDDVAITEEEISNAASEEADSMDVVNEASSVAEIDAEVEASEAENEEPSLRVLLGDDVADQFDSIDDGLSDLENLVISIESALSSLNEGLEEVVAEEESERVSEAA